MISSMATVFVLHAGAPQVAYKLCQDCMGTALSWYQIQLFVLDFLQFQLCKHFDNKMHFYPWWTNNLMTLYINHSYYSLSNCRMICYTLLCNFYKNRDSVWIKITSKCGSKWSLDEAIKTKNRFYTLFYCFIYKENVFKKYSPNNLMFPFHFSKCKIRIKWEPRTTFFIFRQIDWGLILQFLALASSL